MNFYSIDDGFIYDSYRLQSRQCLIRPLDSSKFPNIYNSLTIQSIHILMTNRESLLNNMIDDHRYHIKVPSVIKIVNKLIQLNNNKLLSIFYSRSFVFFLLITLQFLYEHPSKDNSVWTHPQIKNLHVITWNFKMC